MLSFLFLLAAADPRPLLVTVDDLPLTGPLRKSTPEELGKMHDGMLAALKRHGIKAVGLVNFRDLPAHEVALLQRWVEAGHELGNHSASHLDFNTTDTPVFFADVEASKARIAALTQQPVRFFRFPFLREGDTKAKLDAGRAALLASGQRNLPVTIDNQDWSFEGRPAGEDYHAMMRLAVTTAERRGDKLLGRQSPQILLLHAGATGAKEWERLFTWLEKDHRFVTADEVLRDPVFSMPHDFVASNGPGLYDRLRDKADRESAVDRVTKFLAAGPTCGAYAIDAAILTAEGLSRGCPKSTLPLKVLDVRLGKGVEFSAYGDAVPSRVHAVSVVAESAKGKKLLVLLPKGDAFEIVQDATL